MPTRKPAVGLAEIAKKAQVAVSTASRALRNSPEIHPETRRHILQEAKALGYEPPQRSREKQADQALPILVLTAGDAPPSGYMTALSQAAITRGISLQYHNCPSSEAHALFRPEKVPTALKQGLAGGVILLFRWPKEVVTHLAGLLPTASIVHEYPGAAIDTVSIQDNAGMADLVGHLQGLGHTQIGFFGLARELSWSRSRYGAFVNALEGAGLPFHPSSVLPNPFRLETGSLLPVEEASLEAAARKTREGTRAWIVPDEGVAYALEAGLLARGLRIPGDVSVASFHRHPEVPPGLPRLTSIAVDVREMIDLAINRLLLRQKSPSEKPLTFLLPGTLATGDSTGPVPA